MITSFVLFSVFVANFCQEIGVNQNVIELIDSQDFFGSERMRIEDNVKHLNTSDIENRIHIGNRRHKRYVLSGNKWSIDKKDSNSTVILNVGLKVDNPLFVSESSSVLREAAKLWSDVTEIIFQFDENTSLSIEYWITEKGLNDQDNDYEIEPPRPNTPGPSDPFNVRIHPWFLEEEDNIEMKRKMENKFFNLMVHTLGHALGLSHSSATDSVMFPNIGGNFRKNLSNDDITAIQILYDPNPDNPDNNMLNLSPKRADLFPSTDLCTSYENMDFKIDSVLEMPDRKWIFFFKEHTYELGPFGKAIYSPRRIKWDFKEVETPIDATLSWSEDIIFLFKGNKYWKYKNRKFIESRKVSEGFKGIPDGPFDDVFKWNINQKTYFFKGGQYWKYDSRTKSVAQNYPKKVSENWRGIPDSFDAAISSRLRNQTYFFKNKEYFRFDDINKKVVETTPPYPREIDIWFMKCRILSRTNVFHLPTPPPPPPITESTTPTSLQSSTLEQIEDEEEIEEEREGWLIFMTVILGILMLAIIGTGSYLAYLIFIVPVLAAPEERSPRPTEQIPLEQRPQTRSSINPSNATTRETGGQSPHSSTETLESSSSTEHKAVPQKSPDVDSIRSSDGSE